MRGRWRRFRQGSGILALALAAAVRLAPAGHTDERATEARPAIDWASGSFDDFLDSLQTHSPETVTHEGVLESWPAADSLEALILEHGPAYADTARTSAGERQHPSIRPRLAPALLAYNRIEGLRAGLGARAGSGPFTVDVAGAYGSANDAWRYRGAVAIDAGRHGDVEVAVVDLILPYGLAPVPGNGIFALLAGADDQDYLRRKGVTVGWKHVAGQRELGAAFEVVDELGLAAETERNLFGRRRGPRPNPAIDDGEVRRLRLTASAAWRVESLRGAYQRLRFAAAVAGYGFGGDHDYDRYSMISETDLHVPGRDDVRIRAHIGMARNGPPAQSLFYLGGPLLLRAYPVHFQAGDRLLAASIDYHLGTDLLALAGLRRTQIQLVPFAEIGAAWFDDNGAGLLSSPGSGDWKSDAGLALQWNVLFGISARVDLAFRLDRRHDRFAWRWSFKAPLFGRLDE